MNGKQAKKIDKVIKHCWECSDKTFKGYKVMCGLTKKISSDSPGDPIPDWCPKESYREK